MRFAFLFALLLSPGFVQAGDWLVIGESIHSRENKDQSLFLVTAGRADPETGLPGLERIQWAYRQNGVIRRIGATFYRHGDDWARDWRLWSMQQGFYRDGARARSFSMTRAMYTRNNSRMQVNKFAYWGLGGGYAAFGLAGVLGGATGSPETALFGGTLILAMPLVVDLVKLPVDLILDGRDRRMNPSNTQVQRLTDSTQENWLLRSHAVSATAFEKLLERIRLLPTETPISERSDSSRDCRVGHVSVFLDPSLVEKDAAQGATKVDRYRNYNRYLVNEVKNSGPLLGLRGFNVGAGGAWKIDVAYLRSKRDVCIQYVFDHPSLDREIRWKKCTRGYASAEKSNRALDDLRAELFFPDRRIDPDGRPSEFRCVDGVLNVSDIPSDPT